MFLDGFNRGWPALCFTNHRNQASLRQHHFGELVHARGSCGASWADGFVADRVDGAHVVNHAVGEVDGQLLAFGQHVLNALVCSVTACEHLAVEQKRLAGFPAGDFCFGQRVEVHTLALLCVSSPIHVGPEIKRWWV